MIMAENITEEQVYEMNHADDESYELLGSEELDLTDTDTFELVDPEEFCARATDSGDDSSSAETEYLENGTESSDLETDADLGLYFTKFYLSTRGCQEPLLEFPAHGKRKEDMELKDVVKDNLLHFLPAKSLVKFRTVCKEWDKWIISPFLGHKQSYSFRDISGFFCQDPSSTTFLTLDQSAYGIPSPSLEFLPSPAKIRSSCNGLLLCQGWGDENVYYICNPANKQWEVLPPPNCYHGDEPNIVLAFEPSVLNFGAHYQVICAVTMFDPDIYFEIYSSETKCWKCSAADYVELDNSELKDSRFYMEGIAYWETYSGQLLAFDVKNEICGVQPLPPERTPLGVLSQMDGELCYIQGMIQADGTCIISIYGGFDMRLKHSICTYHVKQGVIAAECRVLPSVNSDVLMFLVEDVLYSYHMRDEKVKMMRTGSGFGAKYFPYVNSLVSLPCK
ncbi:hypothetical protein RJ639_034231 [Escallonia herrerae]|uniref:F-box associated beta-propeller type 1 domain-containing protein n=1 Tax=Escallonia herrerae TaxID=1293975 RepID=A0AA88WTG1_9ASTE|nr:hypothetical protein RJ639_034231 [Escallonia herrerae]